jgi:hypothetical protein
MAAGPSPFPAAEKDQKAAAAPDAAPANAEESLLKGAASVASKKNWGN